MLTLTWDRQSTELRSGNDDFAEGEGIQFACSNLKPEPYVQRFDDCTVIVIGSPIIEEGIDVPGAARMVAAAGNISDLNGQFLIFRIDHAQDRLAVISDRYASYPCYYADLGHEFVCSFRYVDLARILKQRGRFEVNPLAAYEFIHLQRLLSDKTLDTCSRYLMPATIMEVSKDGKNERTYWRPGFEKRSDSSRNAGLELAERLRVSMSRRTRDCERYGLFLSGGHDSRTILMAMSAPVTCYTVAFSDNYEVDCARQVAHALGAGFRYLPLKDSHLVDTADTAAELCGGMYAIDNALFLGLEEEIRQDVDVVFHGHGLDYLFQGMYLPSEYVKWFGRPTLFRKLRPMSSDVCQQFIDTIPYRLKYVDLPSFVRPEFRAQTRDYLVHSANEVVSSGNDVCQTPEDQWEYFVIHALSRHYSWPNIGSKMVGAEQRTPCFDSDVFDLYLSLRPDQRITAGALRHAQVQLNKKAAMIPTANLGMPAAASPAFKTAWLIGRKLLRHTTGISSLRAPIAQDRTWPDRDQHMCGQPGYQALVRAALSSDRLQSALPLFDWPKIQQSAEGWMREPGGGAGFLVTLLSLERFLAKLD